MSSFCKGCDSGKRRKGSPAYKKWKILHVNKFFTSIPFASPTNILNKPLRKFKPGGAPRAPSNETLGCC
ncbi:hypothetical protein TNCV_2255561 [Trichonephila clavipes]|nr:hypothetical protein TNCV_2255561 [Trichonephila clavipes]